MRFEDDDFVYASKLPFLYTRKGITELAGAGTKVSAQIKCLTEKINLETLLMKEAEIKLVHPTRSHLSHTYRDIRLITDKDPQFPQAADWKKGEKFIRQWFNVVLQFYLPTQHRIVPVAVHNCWACFTKPQQMNIVSWFKHYLSKHKELDKLYMPLYLKEAGNLVGAPLGSMSHDEIAEVHKNSAAYTTGYVYDEPQYQSLCLDVAAQIQQATHGTSRGLFFPECSNKNLLAYDCLIKTTNFVMGFPLFTLREQGVRLIMKNSHITMEEADGVKTKGGIPI